MRCFYSLLLLLLFPLIGRAQPYRDPDEGKFTIRNLSEINSGGDEYAPYLTPGRDHLYFTSSRQIPTKLERSRREGNQWGRPTPAIDSSTNAGYFDGGSFNAPIPPQAQLFELGQDDLRIMHLPALGMVTLGKYPGGLGDADIYALNVSFNSVDFNEVKPLPSLNSDEWDAQGTISHDAATIIFSSTRSGGEGGMDLWISTRTNDGSYGEPVNLGEPVNSSGNEFSPFIAPDGRTLFFASSGHDGFGGADLFRSRRDDAGRWSEPENLGDKINTSHNELFFFGVGRARCFFASDRPGGEGGLDLYEGTPNIFAPGYSLVTITLPDTTTGETISGRIKIVETTLGRTVAELDVDAVRGAQIPLPSGLSYRLEASASGFPVTTVSLVDIPPDTTMNLSIRFGSTAPEPEMVFEIDGVDVPLFVSGYYRINTPESLLELRARQSEKGDLRRQTYITNVAADTAAFEDYRARAEQVTAIIDNFYRRSVERYFPAYLRVKKPNEHLEIAVYGYADPRPVIGSYGEKSVSFFDAAGHKIDLRSGEQLTNFKLAGLRAYYAVEYLDRRFREAASQGHPEYTSLLNAGAIKWRPISGNIDVVSGGDDLAQKRRIRLVFRRVSGSE